MTPAEIETMAREAYNAIGDRFWSQSEIVSLIYKGCMDLFTANLFIIEKTYTTSTVVGQKEYDKPSTLYSVKKLAYGDAPVRPMSFEEYNTYTGGNIESTVQGTTTNYLDWNGRFILYPVPAEVRDLKIYGYHYPQAITINSALEVPTYMHTALVDFVLARMCAKEKELNALMAYYDKQWKDSKDNFDTLLQLKKSADGYSRVQLEDEIGPSNFGQFL